MRRRESDHVNPRSVSPSVHESSDALTMAYRFRNACWPYGFCKADFLVPILDYTEGLKNEMRGGGDHNEF